MSYISYVSQSTFCHQKIYILKFPDNWNQIISDYTHFPCFLLIDRYLSDIKEQMTSRCFLNVVLTQPSSMAPHVTIFSLNFLFPSFLRHFTFLHTSFSCIKLMVWQKEDLKRKGKFCFLILQIWMYLESLLYLNFYIKMKEGGSLGKINVLLSNVLLLRKSSNFQDLMIHRDRKMYLHIRYSLGISSFWLWNFYLTSTHTLL